MAVTKASPPSVVSRRHRLVPPLATAGVMALVGALSLSTTAYAATAQVDLGTVGSYSVIAGSTVTNTGPSQLSGDVGVFPGEAITGFPPGVQAGTRHAGDAVADQAKSDLGIAYRDAAGRATTESVAGDLVGRTLTSGVYTSSGPLAVSGTVTLDGENTVGSVFIFQVASTLITASSSRIRLIRGADACNVFWQVGSSATLGTNSTFVGTLMALQSISVTTGTVVQGRALARNGAVTLDNNVFSSAACTTAQPTITVTPPPVVVTSPGPTTTTISPTEIVTSPGPTTITSLFPVETVISPGPTTITSIVPTGTITEAGPTSTITRTAAGGAGTATSSSTAAGTSTTSGGRLANTGSSRLLAPLIGGAGLLIVAGVLLMFRGRPKSRHS